MLKIKRQIILILIVLQVISICLLVSCSNTNLQTYQNDHLQYAIDYPENWSVKEGQDSLAIEPPVVLTAPYPRVGKVAIAVIKDSELPPDQIAAGAELINQRVMQDYTTTYKEGKTEHWDWLFIGQGTMDIGDVFFFGYYKQRANYVYKIEGMADSRIWDELLIDNIVSSFRLL